MKFQIIVSVAAMNMLQNLAGGRPHSWVSAEGESVDDLIARLQKNAAKDMRFTDAENNVMADKVRLCWDNQLKNTMLFLNDREMINIAILDEQDMKQRDDALAELLGLYEMGGPLPGETVQ